MWELWLHPDYSHLYIPSTFKQGKFQPQTNIFPGIDSPSSIKPSAAAWVKTSENKNQLSRFEISLLFSNWAE